MWYFSWVLGAGLAISFAIINALWHEQQTFGGRDVGDRNESDSAGPH
jgi:cytochrome bd-I ubiquinol oxidase subunit X